MLLTLLLYSFIAFSSVLVLYYLFGFSRFAFSKLSEKATQNISISVIICAKNEAENLKKFLPFILKQKYPNFEIVLINDASIDDTLEVMEQFKAQHNHIKIVNVANNEAFWGNKKYALTLGIKASKNDYLLFIDADCKPASENWISSMSRHFNAQKKIVLGYGAYQKKKYSVLNSLIRFETLLTAIQYFSYAKCGNPYMGVGRNLAYHKDVFFASNGFINHMNIRSGDDDLFINENATGKNTAIEFSEESHTLSPAPQTFKEWVTQKRRHISTAKHYRYKDQFLLGLFYLSQVGFWALAITLAITTYQWQLVALIFGIKLAIQYIVYGFSAKKLKEQNLIIAIPFLEILLIVFQMFIFIKNSISKPVHWK